MMYEQFPRIPYSDAMLKYGTDKPDLRNPLIINDITDIFSRDDVSFEMFKKLIKSGSRVRCIVTKNTKNKPRSFFDILTDGKRTRCLWFSLFYSRKVDTIVAKGPIGKFFSEEALKEIMKQTNSRGR